MTALDESMKMLGRTPEEHCVNNARLMYRHMYVVYTTLKETFGTAKAEELYWDSWLPFLKQGIENAKKKLGMKKIKGFKDLARVAQVAYLDFPCLSETAELTDDRFVQKITFCANPIYGPTPFDNYLDRADYFRNESWVTTQKLLDLYIEAAGMTGQVDGRLEKIMCLGDDHCRFVFEKKKKK